MPITFTDWLQSIFSTVVRVSPTEQTSIRTDPTINDVDVLLSPRRRYFSNVQVTGAGGYVYADLTPGQGSGFIVREIVVRNTSHAENTSPQVAIFPKGTSNERISFPMVNTPNVGDAIGGGSAMNPLLYVRMTEIPLIQGNVLRVYGYGLAGRTIQFNIIYDEVIL